MKMKMTPDDVDALLHRLPPPVPSPELRGKVLGELSRRVGKAAPPAGPARRRRTFWGGACLAASLGAFGGILWTILPHPAPAGRGGITVADQDPPATDRIPFRTVWEWTGQGEIAGLTLEEGILVVSGSSSLQVTGVDRTSGRVEWKFALPGAP